MFALDEKLAPIRSLVFGFGGRLLERQLFRYLFEGTGPEPVLAALAAYHNADGGFGNGIEPDLMTPESTAIGLETALHYFGLIGNVPPPVHAAVTLWLERNVNEHGTIQHPPADAERYPLQPWWRNADDNRVFAIVGVLRRLGITVSSGVEQRVAAHAMTVVQPVDMDEYHYPIYVYAFFCHEFPRRDEFLADFGKRFPDMCRRLPDRFLALSRYWSPLSPLMDRQLIEAEARRMWNAVDASGRIPTGYPNLPWWDPIMLLDALASVDRQALFVR